jgi:hypothetical protein
LIVEEVVVPGQTVGNPHRLIDLDLLVHYGGKERTEADFSELMGVAGLALARTVPIKDSYFSVLEGIPV